MKYIVITGASKGIGKSIAKFFGSKINNCCLALTYNIDFDGINDVACELSKQGLFVVTVKMDVSNPIEVQQGFDYIYKCFPRIDLLINNAGIALVKPFGDTTLTEWDKVISTNLTGIFNTCKQVADKMNYAGGIIINISSMWGEVGASCEVAYSASKAGMIGFSKALNKEYDCIEVRAISVGFVNTTMNSHMSEQDINDFLAENSDVKLRTTEYVAQKVYEICTDIEQKMQSGNIGEQEDVVIRIW